MGRPSQADLLAFQLEQGSPSTAKAPPSPTPWLDTNYASYGENSLPPSGLPAPPRKNITLTARTAVARSRLEDEEEDEDEDDFGYAKPKRKKESLADLLNSDPPWLKNEMEVIESSPPTTQKRPNLPGFLSKSFRGRHASSQALTENGSGNSKFMSDDDERAFRGGGTGGKKNSAPSTVLRYAKSSASLKDSLSDDTFMRSMNDFKMPTKKLVAKESKQVSESTRDLADFLRNSGPANDLSRQGSRSRASTTGSLDGSVSSNKFAKVFSKVAGFAKVDTGGGASEDFNPTRRDSLLSFHANGIPGVWPTPPSSASPSSPISYRERLPNAYPDVGPLNLTRSASMNRLNNSSGDSTSSRRLSRKPPPSTDGSVLSESIISDHSSSSFISPHTLAALLGEDESTPEILSASRTVVPPIRTASRVSKESATSPVKAMAPPLPPSSLPLDEAKANQLRGALTPPPKVKVSRRPATADTGTHPSSRRQKSEDLGRLRAQTIVAKMEDGAAANPKRLSARGRPTSPPPESPLPAPPSESSSIAPPSKSRNRPVSIAIQPAGAIEHSVVSDGVLESPNRHVRPRPSMDSFVDPPLTGSGATIAHHDPLYDALRGLRRTMRQGASLPLDERMFALAQEEENSALLKEQQLKALLPTLKALQNQMSCAVSLLEVILHRAASGIESRQEELEVAATAEMILLGTDSRVIGCAISESIEETKKEEEKKEEVEEEKYEDAKSGGDPLKETDDEDAFPLLVKHLSMG